MNAPLLPLHWVIIRTPLQALTTWDQCALIVEEIEGKNRRHCKTIQKENPLLSKWFDTSHLIPSPSSLLPFFLFILGRGFIGFMKGAWNPTIALRTLSNVSSTSEPILSGSRILRALATASIVLRHPLCGSVFSIKSVSHGFSPSILTC